MTNAERAENYLEAQLPGQWTEFDMRALAIEFALVQDKARKDALTEAMEDIYELGLSPDDEASDDGSLPQRGDGTTWNRAIRAAFTQIMTLRDAETP